MYDRSTYLVKFLFTEPLVLSGEVFIIDSQMVLEVVPGAGDDGPPGHHPHAGGVVVSHWLVLRLLGSHHRRSEGRSAGLLWSQVRSSGLGTRPALIFTGAAMRRKISKMSEQILHTTNYYTDITTWNSSVYSQPSEYNNPRLAGQD